MISIIICSRDDQRFAGVERMYHTLLAGEEFELLRVPDATSMAEGYNRGIDAARGDLLIFSHDDLEILNRDFVPRLRAHLERFDVVGVAGTTRLIRPAWIDAGPPYIYGQVAHPEATGELLLAIFATPARAVEKIQALDGVFLATKRSVIEKIRFDAATFDAFHHYDLDFSFSAHRAGFRLAVACDIHVLHQSSGKLDDAWYRSRGKFLMKYGNQMSGGTIRPFQYTLVRTPSRQSLAQVMEEVCPGETG